VKKLLQFFKTRFFSEEAVALAEWRAWFSRLALLIGAGGFLVSFFFTFPVYVMEHHYGLLSLDIGAFLLLALLAFMGERSFRLNVAFLLMILYGLMTVFFVRLGPGYARAAWLVMNAVFVVIVLGIKAGLGAVVFNAIFLMVLYKWVCRGNPAWVSVYAAPVNKWLMFVVNVSIMTLATVIPVGFLLSRLDKSLERIREAHQKLSEKNEVLQIEIQQREKSEGALQESEARYRSHFENVTDVVYSIDPDFRISDISPSIERVMGYKPEDIIGRSFAELGILAPEALSAAISDTQRVFSGERNVSNVYEFIAKDGKRIHGETTSSPVFQGGRVVGLVGVARNITERLQAEKALHESEERYRAIVENSHDGILVLDSHYGIVFVNKRLIEITGYTPEEFVGHDFRGFLDDTSREMAAENYRRRQRGEKVPPRYEIGVITKSGEIRRFEVINTIVRDSQFGVRTFSQLMDITEQQKVAEEKEKLQAQLLQAQKMEAAGRLAGGVAHDFNNMLGVIIGNAELAQLKTDSGPVQGKLNEILKAANHSKDIIQQLLAFARKQTVIPRVINLNETVEGLFKMIHRLIGEDIEMLWKPSANLWPVKIDPVQVNQILANLCVNARDAISGIGRIIIETGNITLDETSCAKLPGAAAGDYVMLSVSDDGKGMERETLEKVFEPFFTTKEMGKGTGLGLSTVYGIVKQNQGIIDVYSEPKNGTSFKIYFPKQKGEAENSRTETKEKIPRGHGEVLLLVEDEPAFVKLLEEILTSLGYRVLAASHPSAAIRLEKEHPAEIDLLITDIIMPEMNGKDLAEKLKELHPGLRVLFMSGYTDNVIAQQGIYNKQVSFIQKPFSMRNIAIKIREILDQNGN